MREEIKHDENWHNQLKGKIEMNYFGTYCFERVGFAMDCMKKLAECGALVLAMLCLMTPSAFGESFDQRRATTVTAPSSPVVDRHMLPVKMRQEDIDLSIRKGTIKPEAVRKALAEGRLQIIPGKLHSEANLAESGTDGDGRSWVQILVWAGLWGVGAIVMIRFLVSMFAKRELCGLREVGNARPVLQGLKEDGVRSTAGDKGRFFVDDGGQKTEIPMSEVDNFCKEHGCALGIAMLALATRKGMERRNQERPAPQEMDLPFLGRNPGFNDSVVKTLRDFVSHEGNFRLKLPKTIVPEVAVKALSPSNVQFHFKGQNRANWVHIEYMTNAHEGADIREWVEASMVMFGKPRLGVEEKFEVVNFGWIPAVSKNYLNRHKANEMAAFAGTVRMGETASRVFIVCFRRGNEAWKVEYGFPAAITDTTVDGPVATHKMRKPNPGEEVPPNPSRAELEEAAKVLGWFRPYDAVKCRFCGKIVSDEEVFKVELENVKSDFLPIRTDAIVSIPCCQDCFQRQATGIDLERVKEDEAVRKALAEGGRIKQTWLDAHK